MNIKRAKEEIESTIGVYLLEDGSGEYVIPPTRQRPALLTDPSGVGKTQMMEQISRECRTGLISYTTTHRTRQSAVGPPSIKKRIYGNREYTVTEYTMSGIVASIYDRVEEIDLKEGVLFIDEIDCVSKILAPTTLRFLQCKTFESRRIPGSWIIAAADNPPEYSKSVRGFDVVVLDRIRRVGMEPDLGVWKEHAYAENIHLATAPYLNIKGQSFCQIEATVDRKLLATSRAWEDLLQPILVYESLDKGADRDAISQYIQHPRIAKGSASYLELYYKYQNEYQMDEILQDVAREALCGRVTRAPSDERFSITYLILSKLTEGSKKLRDENAFMKLLTEQLKSHHQGMTGKVETSTIPDKSEVLAMVLASLAQELERERFRREKNGLSERREDRLWFNVRIVLEECTQQMKKEAVEDRGQAWEWARIKLMKHSGCYEAMKEDCGSRLEHAFDSMEATFGNGQEMAIFVMELNASEACVRFLNEYECEHHYQYNKDLFFDEREQAIGQKL